MAKTWLNVKKYLKTIIYNMKINEAVINYMLVGKINSTVCLLLISDIDAPLCFI